MTVKMRLALAAAAAAMFLVVFTLHDISLALRQYISDSRLSLLYILVRCATKYGYMDSSAYLLSLVTSLKTHIQDGPKNGYPVLFLG